MFSIRPIQISLCLLAAIAASKTEARLVEDYPFPANSDPDFSQGMMYSSINFATIASLDLDMRSIVAYVSSNSQSGYDSAQNIFQQGAFSDVYANLMIIDPTGKFATSETNIVAGSTVTGKTASGREIVGIAKYGKVQSLNGSEASENVLQVHYPKVLAKDINSGCFAGGNPTPITDGCFAPTGTITISGFGNSYEFQYSYQPQYDNRNGLSLASLDRLRGQAVTTTPPETLTKFLNYYDNNSFYDQDWIEAVFRATATTGSNGAMDFSTFGYEERSSAIRTGIVALRTWFFVLNSIDDAVAECGQQFGGQFGLTRWDHAVAAYSGSIPIETTSTDYSLGYFLFTMAQTQCKYLGTCDQITGVAKVNQDVFELFRTGRTQMVNADCDNAKISAQKLRSKLTVPLIQGLLRAVHNIDEKDVIGEGNQGNAVAYAAALLPLLHDCSVGYAFSIYDSVKPERIQTISYAVIKDSLEQTYDCLQVTCEEIGGLLNFGGSGWFPGAEPCGVVIPAQQPTPPVNPNPIGDDDNFVPSSGSIIRPADDDDFKMNTAKNRFRTVDKQQALLIGIFSGLGVLAAIIAIVVGCRDSKRAKEFDTANGPTSSADMMASKDDDVVISTSTEVV